MFSWEDQELANIIWGEADDHIVPYPEESERKSQSDFVYRDNIEAHEEFANIKLSEQKPAATKTKLHGGKPESNDGKETDLEKDSEISIDHDEDIELGDIISNSWANIGGFDDLDCIFSNDVLLDHASLDRTDELWTSSRDAVKSSSLALDSTSWGLESIGNSSGQFGFNTEYLHNRSQSDLNRFEKPADSTCYRQETLHSSFDEGEIDGTTDPQLILEKTKALSVTGKTISKPQDVVGKFASTSKSLNKNKWLRSQPMRELKSGKINNDREPQDMYDTWLPPEINVQKFDSQYVPDKSKSYLSSFLDQQNMPHQSSCLSYQHFSDPYLPAYSDGNLSDQCNSMSVLPGADEQHQPVLSNPEVFLSERVLMDKSIDIPMKSQNMTPKEKIEKLRRRQQMRALHAIKKQQQQLSHPVPITDYSNSQKSSKGAQVLHGSSAVSMEEVDHNVEDTVLYKLQDDVTKLDTKIRLCISDSLFRLGQSAMQRNYASDLSCGNRHGGCEPDILKENISNQESFMKMPSAETETNCIDRAVAYLLFHQPHKSTSKHTRTPSSVPLSFVTKTSESEHKISTQKDLSEQPQTDTSMNQKIKQKMVESAD